MRRKDKVPEPWPMQAAKASWMAPGLGAMVAGLLSMASGDNPDFAGVISLLVLILMYVLSLLGLGMGIASLTQMKRFGLKGILIPASLGILLDTFLLVMLSIGLLVWMGVIDQVF